VPQPPADDIHLDARLKQVDRGRVAKDMRTDVPPLAARTKLLRVTTDELVHPEPRKRDRETRGEDRMVWWQRRRRVRAQTVELLSRLGPEWARPPLVALAMEANAGGRLQIEIPPSEIHGLLHAGAGVIEEQEERAVTPGVAALSRQGREERTNVLALKEARLRQRRPFHRNGRDALGDRQKFRHTTAQILEERVQTGQALIPCANAVMADRLQVVQKAEGAFETQVVEGELGDLPASVLRDEPQEQTERVAIAVHGGRTEPLHRHEAVKEEGL